MQIIENNLNKENHIDMNSTELIMNQCQDFRFCISEAMEISNNKDSIKELIKKGGQVNMDYFDAGWGRNPIVATIWSDEKLVACGALKVPDPIYKQRLFVERAKTADPFENIKYELGWIVTDEAYRGRGFCINIIKMLLNYKGTETEETFYATSRLDNLSIQKILKCQGFRESGEPFKSKRGDYKLILYVLNVETKNNRCQTTNMDKIEVHMFKKEFLSKYENAERYAVMNAATFKKCVGYKKSDVQDAKKLEGMLKITNPCTRKSIYRRYYYDSKVENNAVLLSLTARSELGFTGTFHKNNNWMVSIERANWFCYYLRNSDSSIRMPFRLAILALVCSVLSVLPQFLCFLSHVIDLCGKFVSCLQNCM